MKAKNALLVISVFIALAVAGLSAMFGFTIPMFIGLGYMLFMLINNWEYVVGKKIDKEELEDAIQDCQMIRLYRKESDEASKKAI